MISCSWISAHFLTHIYFFLWTGFNQYLRTWATVPWLANKITKTICVMPSEGTAYSCTIDCSLQSEDLFELLTPNEVFLLFYFAKGFKQKKYPGWYQECRQYNPGAVACRLGSQAKYQILLFYHRKPIQNVAHWPEVKLKLPVVYSAMLKNALYFTAAILVSEWLPHSESPLLKSFCSQRSSLRS